MDRRFPGFGEPPGCVFRSQKRIWTFVYPHFLLCCPPSRWPHLHSALIVAEGKSLVCAPGPQHWLCSAVYCFWGKGLVLPLCSGGFPAHTDLDSASRGLSSHPSRCVYFLSMSFGRPPTDTPRALLGSERRVFPFSQNVSVGPNQNQVAAVIKTSDIKADVL